MDNKAYNLIWLQDTEGQKQLLEAQGLRNFALKKCYIDMLFFQKEVNRFLKRRIYLERLETNLHLKEILSTQNNQTFNRNK